MSVTTADALAAALDVVERAFTRPSPTNTWGWPCVCGHPLIRHEQSICLTCHCTHYQPKTEEEVRECRSS